MLTEAGKTKNGVVVYIDNEVTHRHGFDGDVLREMIGRIELHLGENDCSISTLDMGRVMGTDNCLETCEGDTIVMFHRPTGNGDVRAYPSRMIMNREAQPTTMMTLIIGNAIPEKLPLVYAYYAGIAAEREPGDPSLVTPEEIRVAEEFWAHHALVPTEEERKLIEK